MANAIITFKLMPEDTDIDLEALKEKAFEIAQKHGSKGQMQAKIEPVAFGLKQLLILAMYAVEDKDFDAIAAELATLEGIQSAEVYKMDLAMG
jgi:elongation factor 1-beta